MTTGQFGFELITALVQHCLDGRRFEESTGADGGPRLRFHAAKHPDAEAGFLRLWRGDGSLDRMLHVRLRGDPADTQLFFLFARSDTVVPHFHAQVVQFGEAGCVYNADLLPRLDAVDHPDYFSQVFEPLTRDYWKATQTAGNACAGAPTNPAIAVYLSPWSLGASRPTDRDELDRVRPQIVAYLDHCLALAAGLDYPCPDPDALRSRDRRHLACFFDERLDRRAWKGVYGLIGADQGHEMRRLMMQNLYE